MLKGLLVDDEVSVAQLLEREGWDEHEPPRPGSRLRVLAVMGAVVLGCGIAAVLVRPAPEGEPQALWPEETNLIEVPGTPTGGGLPGSVALTATVAGTSSERSTVSVSATDDADDTSESSTPTDTTSSTSATSSVPTPTGGSSSARDDPPAPTGEPSETRSSNPPPPATTTRPPDDDDDYCWFPLFC